MSQASKPKLQALIAGDMSGTGVDDCNKEDASDDEGDSSSSSYSSCDENATPKSTLSPLGGRVKRRHVLRLIAEASLRHMERQAHHPPQAPLASSVIPSWCSKSWLISS